MKSKVIATTAKALAILILFPGTFVAKGQTNVPDSLTPVVNDTAAESAFRVISHRKSNTIRVDAGTTWVEYQRYELIPAIYRPTDACNCLSSRDVTKLTAALDGKLKSTFKKEIAGQGATLRIQPSITSVKLTNTTLNVLSFAAIQAPVSYGAASVRFDLIDRASGRKVGEVTSMRHARPWNVYPWNLFKNFQATGQSTVILRSDAKRLKADLALLASQPKSALPESSTGGPNTGLVAASR